MTYLNFGFHFNDYFESLLFGNGLSCLKSTPDRGMVMPRSVRCAFQTRHGRKSLCRRSSPKLIFQKDSKFFLFFLISWVVIHSRATVGTIDTGTNPSEPTIEDQLSMGLEILNPQLTSRSTEKRRRVKYVLPFVDLTFLIFHQEPRDMIDFNFLNFNQGPQNMINSNFLIFHQGPRVTENH